MKGDKLWNINYIRVLANNFALHFSLYLLAPLLPLYLSETFDATKDTIGLVLSGYTLVALFVRPFSGFLVDSYPRKLVLVIGFIAYFLICGSYLVVGSLVLFAVVRTLHGGPFGAVSVANSTVAIDVLPSSRRTEGIGYYGLSNNLASAFAPTIGVFIYQHTHSFDLLFWLAFIMAGLGLLNAYTMKVPRKELIPDKRPLSWDRFFLLRGWLIGLNIIMFGFCWGLLSNYLAIYGKEHLGITSGTGTYFMLLSAGLIVSRLWGSRSLRAGKLTHNATEGILLSSAGYLIFIAWPSMVGYYTSAILIGLGNGHMWPALQNMIIDVAHHNERGTANSTILASWDLGVGMGVLFGGVVAEFLGYDAAFWMMAAVHIVGLGTYMRATKGDYVRKVKAMRG